MIKVAIVETSVFNVKAYHAKCLNCNWQSKRKDKEEAAVNIGSKHSCKTIGVVK